jgi:hypothetical protein
VAWTSSRRTPSPDWAWPRLAFQSLLPHLLHPSLLLGSVSVRRRVTARASLTPLTTSRFSSTRTTHIPASVPSHARPACPPTPVWTRSRATSTRRRVPPVRVHAAARRGAAERRLCPALAGPDLPALIWPSCLSQQRGRACRRRRRTCESPAVGSERLREQGRMRGGQMYCSARRASSARSCSAASSWPISISSGL